MAENKGSNGGRFFRIVRPEDRADGGKTFWNEVGIMFPKDDGSFFIKLYMFGDAVFRAFAPDEQRDEKAAAAKK